MDPDMEIIAYAAHVSASSVGGSAGGRWRATARLHGAARSTTRTMTSTR